MIITLSASVCKCHAGNSILGRRFALETVQFGLCNGCFCGVQLLLCLGAAKLHTVFSSLLLGVFTGLEFACLVEINDFAHDDNTVVESAILSLCIPYWHGNAVLHNEKNSTNACNKAQSAKRIRFEYVFVVSSNQCSSLVSRAFQTTFLIACSIRGNPISCFIL